MEILGHDFKRKNTLAKTQQQGYNAKMITEKLKQARAKKSRIELAKIAGVDQSTFYRWETGESKPRGDQLKGLWAACQSVGVEVKLEDFF